VPELSARRGFYGVGNTGLNPALGTVCVFSNGDVSHQGLVTNEDVLSSTLLTLNSDSQINCSGLKGAIDPSNLLKSSARSEAAATATYYLRLVGVTSLQVSDSSGINTNPLSDPPDAGLAGVTSIITGAMAADLVVNGDQDYSVTFGAAGPMLLEIVRKSDGPDEVVRYQNLILPSGVSARINLHSDRLESLSYDANGDGTFETLISPTASVTGLAAQDLEPPEIVFNSTRQANNATVTIFGTDSGSGVKATYYSSDGTHFQPYTGPFSVDVAQVSTIYAFADDNVANRSGLVTFALPAPITVQYNSASYSTGEADGMINVSVTRSVDTSSAASVAYATSNGTAREGRDYIAAQGVLNFAAGETSKTFPVLIIDNAFVDGARTVNLTLNNPTGATLAQSTAVLTINDNDTSTGTNPVDQSRSFVEYHYFDFLGRYPDQSGWDFWTNQITVCGTDIGCNEVRRINVSVSFFLSIEFQQTGYLVYRIYKASFGNLTDIPNAPVPIKRQEFLPDTQEIGNGVIVNQGNWQQQLEANKQAFTLEFVQRARFTAAFPTTMTPAQFVDKLFSNAGVTPSSTDRNAAIAEFGSATTTGDVAARSRALRDVAENATLNAQEFNKAFVLMEYFGYLRRNPYDPPESTLDYSGFNFWLTKLNQFNGNYINAEMVKAFLSSIEYRQRFGP
jgi:hypothetical protein